MEKRRIAVIGAGPMGLACAHALLKKGHTVTIYEADKRIGGMSASFDFDGLEIERYYHFICQPDQSMFDMLNELGISDKLRWSDTRMGFYFDGKLYEWGRPDCLIKFPKLDLISKLRYALHVMYTKSIKDWSQLDKLEATSWLRRWVGEKAFQVLWQNLFDLKFFEFSQNLSAAWIGTRIKRVALSRKNIFQERLGFLEGGSETFLTAIENKITTAGGIIKLSAPFQGLRLNEQGNVNGIQLNSQVDDCDAVFSTIPLQYLPSRIPEFSNEEKNRLAKLQNIAVACVVMKLHHSVSPYFWLNINDKNIAVPGMIEYSNLNNPGAHVLYVPYYMPKHHPNYQRDDQEFFKEVHGYLQQINPHFQPQWVMAQKVSRYEFAQPVCTPNFYAKLPPMRTSINGFYMADTSYYYPEDRSISESIRIGCMLAEELK